MRHEVVHLKNHFPFLGEGGCDPTLAVYLPHIPEEMNRQDLRRPAILICPGGGYNSVSQREGEPIALHFFPEGYCAFVLTYSVAEYNFPVQIREVAAAMELIHENAAKWNVDTSRVAILGFSAGGHLAAHYTNSYDCAEVRQVFPESKPVQASILCYPVITATEGQCHPGSFRKLVGHFPLTEEEHAKFSCHRLVTQRTPPTFLWHTAADASVPVVNSLLYAQALSQHSVPFALHIYPYGHHGLATVDKQTNNTVSPAYALGADWLPQVKQWLKIVFA